MWSKTPLLKNIFSNYYFVFQEMIRISEQMTDKRHTEHLAEVKYRAEMISLLLDEWTERKITCHS